MVRLRYPLLGAAVVRGNTRGYPRPRAARATPEAALQVRVKEHLAICLPPSVLWTASLAGHGKLSMAARNRAKAMGLKPGWPDLQFLFPDGVTRYIELKSDTGRLQPEQADFQARCRPHGIHAVCRSVEEVDAALRAWGAPMRNHPFGTSVRVAA